jgi:hypothetical protein
MMQCLRTGCSYWHVDARHIETSLAFASDLVIVTAVVRRTPSIAG